MEWLAPAVALLGALISAACALLAWGLSRRGQRAEAHERINQRYDRLMEFRASHPKVLALGFRWLPENFNRIYGQAGSEDQDWVLYYTYVELVLGFCNASAYAARCGALDEVGFEQHYKPLMKLLLTEHQPIMADLLQGGSCYVSPFVSDFWNALEADGWNWAERHAALKSGEPPNKAMQADRPAAGR